MKHIKLFEGFLNEAENPEIKALAKKLKFPAGTTFHSGEASWSKRGGHAGTNMVDKVMKNAEALGWKREFKQSTHPAYDHVSNKNMLFDPEGFYQLEGSEFYGNTAAYNSYSLRLKFLKEQDED